MPHPLDGLDEAQRAAVAHPAGALVVTGGAGSGRSHVVARRAARLVEDGERAAGVLVIAPTRVHATRLRAAAEAVIESAYEELSFTTPADLAAAVLASEAATAGLDPHLPIASAADRVVLLLDSLDELTLRRHEIRGNPAPLAAALVARIDALKARLISAQDFSRQVGELSDRADSDAGRAQAERELEFARVYADHERLLHERGLVDRGGVLTAALGLLRERADARARVEAMFPHVVADDVAGLPEAERALVGVLAAGTSSAVATAPTGAADAVAQILTPSGDAERIELLKGHRCPRRVASAVCALAGDEAAAPPEPASSGGEVRCWRTRSERAQAQGVAAEAQRLIGQGASPSSIGVVVASTRNAARPVVAALEERQIPARVLGAAAFFERSEVRDVLAWLRLLSDPGDSRAAVRALTRPPIGLRSADVARLTQLANRRKLDIVAAIRLACEGPQLSPEGRDAAQVFLKLHRAAAAAFDALRPDAFLHRLIERLGLRRRQLFAPQATTVERLVNLAKLGDLASAFAGRDPHASARDFSRHMATMAAAGLAEDEAEPPALPAAVRVMEPDAARELELDHVFVLGLEQSSPHTSPAQVALGAARARRSLVLSWCDRGEDGARPSSAYSAARQAVGAAEELLEEELLGPAEGLHSTFRLLRDELLETVSGVGERLGEMRLDSYMHVSQAMARYLELLKLAALIERDKQGQPIAEALPEVNELIGQGASEEQRELLRASGLDEHLLAAERGERRLRAAVGALAEGSLESFIPRRGDGLMLSASDIETYRLCPAKYKFARVFRIPQEPTINQRFGIAMHQTLERWHGGGDRTLESLMAAFEQSWRRCGFGEANDDVQFHAKAVAALERYWRDDSEREGDPVWFERAFSFKLGAHRVRGRVDRVDRLPDGGYELIDYKTGRAKTEAELREDLQLSLYQMGAREAWELETSAQSYYYVLDNRKVPVAHSSEELDRVRTTVAEIAGGIMAQDFEPSPSPDLCPFCDYRIICPAAEK